jgi:phage gp36-like protein
MTAAYTTLARVKAAMPAAFFQGTLAPTDAHVQQVIDDVCAMADGYIASKYTLPLVAPYDAALSQACDRIVKWTILADRGFNPDSPTDVALRFGYTDAIKWLERLADGKIKLSSLQGDPPSMQPDVSTSCSRGLGRTYTGPIGGPDWGM